MTDFAHLLRVLASGQVDFILVGGVAATIHGSSRLTQDIDVVYSRQPENVARLVLALEPLDPYLRDAPPGLPFHWGTQTLLHGLNFTLTTTSGALDLLGEITGGGGYEQLLPHTIAITAFEVELRCLDLESLIRVKRAAGRPKDFEAIAELETILDQRRQ
jgi:predicted nucleotidyltransferase